MLSAVGTVIGGDMRQTIRILPLAFILAGALIDFAHADVDADKAAIAGRLRDWTAAFNTRNVAGTCGLFAPDLIATFRGAPDRGRDAICKQIAAALADPNKEMRYSAEIREIMVSGDMAVVRLVWTTTVEGGGKRPISQEPGLDIFERQTDGTWSIIRYMAFSNEPD